MTRPKAPARRTLQIPPDFQALLDERGLSLQAASKLAGGPDVLRDLFRTRTRSLRADTVARLAAGLGVEIGAVTRALGLAGTADRRFDAFIHDPGLPLARRRRVAHAPELPVRHAVQAGAWMEVDETPQAARRGPAVAFDARVGGVQWLEEVVGDSVDRLAPEGAFLHVVEALSIGYAPKRGDLVVVERRRAGLRERSVKLVEIGRAGALELWPASTNPRWAAPLRLAPEAGAAGAEEAEVEIVGRVLGVYRPMM